jgi:hypothetical protein
MASSFLLTLDTQAPQGADFDIAAGASVVTAQVTTADFATTDPDTTGYQVLIWGDVDTSFDAAIQATEGASSWKTYSASIALKLSSGDGTKNVHAKIRDDVLNTTSQLDDSITLDTSVPTITITAGPDANGADGDKVSEVTGADKVQFSFQSDQALQAYKVKVVANGSSLHSSGTQIPTTAGSTNMSGGSVAATTNVDCEIDGTDYKAAVPSNADGEYTVKVFGQDVNGLWSVAA